MNQSNELGQQLPALVTCSYLMFRCEMGVPIVTSIGAHPRFDHAPEASSLKPFGIFRVMDDRPLEERIRAYRHRLHRHQVKVEAELADLAATYPGVPLVLLCWCSPKDAHANLCHRRWFACWWEQRHGIEVPEARP